MLEAKAIGIVVEKESYPQTIEERFAIYDVSTEKNEVREAMKEFAVGEMVGEEQWGVLSNFSIRPKNKNRVFSKTLQLTPKSRYNK